LPFSNSHRFFKSYRINKDGCFFSFNGTNISYFLIEKKYTQRKTQGPYLNIDNNKKALKLKSGPMILEEEISVVALSLQRGRSIGRALRPKQYPPDNR